ncbi:hypothetical protein COW36_11005 [bacterium (Candidatus Blackallbacteria) CG17_big_fil_post_rev_8_21_14_2_50_48_46]|uniref:SMP-30/Gluconolactonase/LRE-like region domain-containing protein n=1 Tax=bacterium (Candidatus Blackallbacteria) CG17_big_fil_post_rev_8_21_14_2_50_48_46 TaxID=2014261 RepID=A0A2M7G4H4_9BACT|nr:MAG: hypothetical protein COW64_18100 [bacterium (Candidatus Blackallbacteria) CG18_big_fil_WC_8_21_14_2_50_49_26]PIW16803.1 MAG: hypothetical protein COW36_11005 [bacterium (Candidatus Blackallbacteria) CG17_big_fil_post_rev_8_21_14_2_50_48_46]PIW48000.1 MAG: hypothetical protein COW20_10720 [bacterium (Candidatus Blackallbacteria) CG13_big_fil_rev_8_21_14_2_50_49_14]
MRSRTWVLLSLLFCSCTQELPGRRVRSLADGAHLKFEESFQRAVEPQKAWRPGGLAVSQEGLVFLSDLENNRILRITPTGVIQVFAGDGEEGDRDGAALTARFKKPRDLVFDREGQLWVADSGNQKIKRISPTGQVSTYPWPEALKHITPHELLFDARGQFYVMDSLKGELFNASQNQKLIQTGPNQLPRALANTASGELFYADLEGIWKLNLDSTRTLARRVDSSLRRVGDLISDQASGFYLTDLYFHRLLHWQADTGLEQIAGGPSAGDKEGAGALFSFPEALALGSGGEIYLADTRNQRICKIEKAQAKDWKVSTFARNGTQGFGERKDDQDLSLPHGLVFDERSQNLIVSDYLHHRLLKISLKGEALPWFEPKDTQGEPLVLPAGLAMGSDHSLYISGSGRHRIHKISPEGKLSVLAGSGQAGLKDGLGKEAQFYLPFGIAVGPDQSVYVIEQGNHTLRKISPAGEVSTLAGDGTAGLRDGRGQQAQFNHPSGLAWHPEGYLLVADAWNHAIRRVTLQGEVSTVLGGIQPGQKPYSAQEVLEKGLYVPEGIVVSPAGEVYIADSWNHRIGKWKAPGKFEVIAGKGRYLNFGAGFADALGEQARFSQPKALALGPQGALFIADTANNRIRWIEP